MEISYQNTKLMKVFNSEVELIKSYGQENGRLIMRRMVFLKNTPNLAMVPTIKPLRRHQLTNNRKGQYAVDIKNPSRLIFVPDYEVIPLKQDGGYDIDRIEKIKILGVEGDYH